MNDSLKDFLKRLRKGPTVLFLGQDYLRLDSEEDPFLTEIIRKYGRAGGKEISYRDIFKGKAGEAPQASLVWMQERARRISVPSWLKQVAEFPWNSVFTSAFDGIWLQSFRREWRQIQPIYTKDYNPINPSNPRRLNCTFLFGSIQGPEESTPPLNEQQYSRRQFDSESLAQRLPEVVTPLGVLAIEGYGVNDWFSLKSMDRLLAKLNPSQAHIFQVKDDLESQQIIGNLVNEGRLFLHEESLVECLVQGEKEGLIQFGRSPLEEDYGYRIECSNQICSIPLDLWNTVTRSATILDDVVLIPPKVVSTDRKYQEFRTFLFEASIRPDWIGYARGFAFERDYGNRLHNEILRQLKSNKLHDEPVILYGQTGTGKTVALGHLAYRIRSQKEYPVLFIERKNSPPNYSDIDTFCIWAKKQKLNSILIIWDGMRPLSDYRNLCQYLSSRGHKVVIVGSCYIGEADIVKTERTHLKADANLTKDELKRFEDFLNGFDPRLGELINEGLERYKDTFLASLYRFLPPTRAQLRSGVLREFRHVLGRIQETVMESDENELDVSPIAAALYKAGLINKNRFFKKRSISGEQLNDLERFLLLVIVPGQFGLRVPSELIIRVLGSTAFQLYAKCIEETSELIVSVSDSNGNIIIAPRHSLEAQFIVQSYLGGPKEEVKFMSDLIFNVRDMRDEYFNPEIDFVVELLEKIGPNSPRKNYYKFYFLELSRILTKIREDHSILHPRMILKEAHLLRESVYYKNQEITKKLSQNIVIDDEDKDWLKVESVAFLTKATHAIQEGLKLVDKKSNMRMFVMLQTELATTLRSLGTQIRDHGENPKESLWYYEQGMDLFPETVSIWPTNFHPYEVFIQTVGDFMKTHLLSSSEQNELKTRAFNAFLLADSQVLSEKALERFHQCRMQFFEKTGRVDISQDSFKALEKMGSYAGYFLKAYSMVQYILPQSELSLKDRNKCRKAFDYLEMNHKKIAQDIRCLNLLLKAWWNMKTGKSLFYKELQTLPFTSEDWTFLFKLLIEIENLDILNFSAHLKFLKGLTTFHLGNMKTSEDIFKELDTETYMIFGRRRIVKSYLASDESGKPRTYNGEVSWISFDGSKGEIYISEIGINVHFRPREFGKPDIRRFEAISDFFLGFNFRGLVAAPKFGYTKV